MQRGVPGCQSILLHPCDTSDHFAFLIDLQMTSCVTVNKQSYLSNHTFALLFVCHVLHIVYYIDCQQSELLRTHLLCGSLSLYACCFFDCDTHSGRCKFLIL